MTTQLPHRLNFGSGRSFAADMLNIDIIPARNPDLVLDLAQPIPFGAPLSTRRFGPVTLAPGSFDHILADNVMEHVADLPQAMTNCLDLLAMGGTLEVRVPYDLSYGAWQDPTHVRAFNERSWAYYCEWAWYVGWLDARFEVVTISYVLSGYGTELVPAWPDDLVGLARQPRAVDQLDVTLRKRPIDAAERALFAAEIGGNV